MRSAVTQPVLGRMPSLEGATAWVNSPPLETSDLRGRVVAVQFWTYTCINWLRSLPPLRAWDEAYRDRGLVVIGVHSPEFSFERNIAHVHEAVRERRISYPVAIDSDFTIWRAFANHYWPALYLVDVEGRIRLSHFGEVGYEEAEMVTRDLLSDVEGGDVEGGPRPPDPLPVRATGVEAPADWETLRSPETYLGYQSSTGFASPGGVRADIPHDYTLPERSRFRQWALAGPWTFGAESVAGTAAGGRIVCSFQARDVHLVMGASPGSPAVRFRVSLDGQAPGDDHGLDIDSAGNGTATVPRLYQLVRQQRAIEERTIEIEFLDPGIEAYVFTFG